MLRRFGQETLVLLTVVLLISSSMVGFVGSAAAQPDSGSFVTLDDSVEVWERSALPLRADTSNAAETVPLPVIDLNDGEGAIPANREDAAVYDQGSDISVTLGSPTGADPYGLNDDNDDVDVQVLVAKLDEDGDIDQNSLTTDLGDLRDMFATEDANNNVTIVEDELYHGLSEPFEYTFSNADSGNYAIVVAQVADGGTGAQVDGDGNVTSIDGDLSVLGVETVAVQQASASATPQSSPEPGDSVTFDADSNLPNSQVNHSLVVYKKDTFESSEWELIYDGEFTSDVDASDVEVDHSIRDVNGVSTIEEDATLFGSSISEREDRGVFAFQDIARFVANESDSESPQMSATDDTVLHASAVAVQSGPDEELTIETLEDWDEGEYQFVYMASGADSTEFSTDTGTLTVEEDTAAPSEPTSPTSPTSPSPTPVTTIPVELDDDNTTVGDGFVANNTRFGMVLSETDEDRRSGVRFTSINATTTRDVNVGITVTRSATSPDAGAGEPPTNAGGLTYLQLEYDQSVADSVDSVEFNFRVSKDRLDQLGQESGDVALYRYDGGEWTELSPEQVRESDTHYHYRADSPGLSLYATSIADPDIQVTEASLSATEIETGESVTVNAEVENNGGSGEETVDLVVDGEVLDSQTVSLSADETTTVAFEPTFEEAGEYDIAVNEVSAGTLSVVDTEDPTDPTDPDDPDEGISVVLIAIVLVVALALAGSAYYVLYYQE